MSVFTQGTKADDLEALFDYKYYVRHVDEIFERVGLK